MLLPILPFEWCPLPLPLILPLLLPLPLACPLPKTEASSASPADIIRAPSAGRVIRGRGGGRRNERAVNSVYVIE